MDENTKFDYYYGIEADQFSFYRVPRLLIKDERFKGLSSDAKLLYLKKLKPQYNGDVYLETVRCYFDISQENLEKCRYTYQGNETYAFLMSDKYIMALYTHCLVARKEVAMQGMQIEGFTEKECGMVKFENVRDVLFQVLLLDNVKLEDDKVYAELCTIFVFRW